MKYRIAFLALFFLGVIINYYFDTKDISYNFSVMAAILGAIAYLVGTLAIVLFGFAAWGVVSFVRNKRLPDKFLDKFFLFGLCALLLSITSRFMQK